MKDVQQPIISDQIRSAIEKSTDFSRALYKLQPESVSLSPLLAKDGSQLTGASEHRLRVTASSALFSVALDHHVALVLLLRHNMRSSAFALLRAIFDAVWRGAWAAYIAPHENLDAFLGGRYDPSPDAAIRQLEQAHGLPPVLSRIKRQGWAAMSAFVHGGGLQVQRWVGDGIIEPQHSDAELLEVLDVADRLAFAACVLFLDVAGLERDELTAVADKFLT